MAQQQNNPIEQVLELLTEQGSDALAEALRILLNAAMLFERDCFLNAAPCERTAERRDYANGFNPKRLRAYLTLAYLRCAARTSTHRRLSEVHVLSER